MLFSNGDLPKILTAKGFETEMVRSNKYLGITIDPNLSFKPHIENLKLS